MNRVYYSTKQILTKNIHHKKYINKLLYANNKNNIRKFSTSNYSFYSNKPPNKNDFVYIIAAGVYLYVICGEPPQKSLS
jgi:hypothetical protein